MKKLYFALIFISCFVCRNLYGQHVTISKQRLAAKLLYEYDTRMDFVEFYETILPGDTVFRLSISYNGYENYLLSFLESPVFRYVQELTLSGNFDEVPVAITNLKQLKALFIHNHSDGGCEGECPVYIPNEVYRFPELEVLSISANNVSITDSIINLKKLRHLFISPVSLQPYLFTGMPQLKSIDLNFYLSSKVQSIKVFNKLVTFNNTYRDAGNWHYSEETDDESFENKPDKTPIIHGTVDFKLKDPYDKKTVIFSFQGKIENNVAVGPWIVKSDYSLLANYADGKSRTTKIMKDDTAQLAIITRNSNGEERQDFKNVKKYFKNGIPFGKWDYYQYYGDKCYQQILYNQEQGPTPAKADTTGYFIRKIYMNGKEHGTWKESTFYSKKTTEFENGKPVKITDYDNRFTTPTTIKEFRYAGTATAVKAYYRKKPGELFLYSQGTYRQYIPDGEFLSYHRNGSIREKKVYRDGKITGDVIGNDENGKPQYIYSYESGIVIHEKSFHKNGLQAQEVYYNKNGKHGTESSWSETGKLSKMTFYQNGLPQGVSQTFDDHGKVISETYYENGKVIYNQEQGFENTFIHDDQLFRHYAPFSYETVCCRYKNCTLTKKQISDSTFALTEYQYSEKAGRHLKYIKEYHFKNYRLDGLQIVKDSLGKPLESVTYKSGIKHGTFTRFHSRSDLSISVEFQNDTIKDTVLIYSSHKHQSRAEVYYKNKNIYLKKMYNPQVKGTTVIISYSKHSKKAGFGLYFVPESAVWIEPDSTQTKTMKFHGKITDLDGERITGTKGSAIINGKKAFLADNTLYDSIFRDYCTYNIFFRGWLIYH